MPVLLIDGGGSPLHHGARSSEAQQRHHGYALLEWLALLADGIKMKIDPAYVLKKNSARAVQAGQNEKNDNDKAGRALLVDQWPGVASFFESLHKEGELDSKAEADALLQDDERQAIAERCTRTCDLGDRSYRESAS